MFNGVPNGIVRLSPHNIGATLPANAQERASSVRANVAELALFAANGAFAGTPVAYATGSATVVYGAGLALAGIAQGLFSFGGSKAVALKNLAAGAACILGGVTAFMPGVGQAVNLSLAAFSGVAATAAATTPVPSERPAVT